MHRSSFKTRAIVSIIILGQQSNQVKSTNHFILTIHIYDEFFAQHYCDNYTTIHITSMIV